MNNPMFPAETHIIAEEDDAPTIPCMRAGLLIFPDRVAQAQQDEHDASRFDTFSDDDFLSDDLTHDDLHVPTSGWID